MMRWKPRLEVDRFVSRIRALGILSAFIITGSWFYLNRSMLGWFARALPEISVFNGWMLAVGVLLLGALGYRYRQRIQLSAPTLHPLPLALMLGCGIGAISTRWLIALEQLPVVLFLFGTYGMLGLCLDPATWRKGLPLGAAIACLLPFGVQFSTGLGAPARVLTSQGVAYVLHLWSIPAISTEDIILLDTGVAYVDNPCSGLKSMWTGTLFLLAATWLEGRQIGMRWLLVCLANLGLLAIANTSRVIVLVVLTYIVKQPLLAEMMHVPLGLMGFLVVSAATWGLLRWVPRQQNLGDLEKRSPPRSTVKAPFIITACILVLTLIPQPPIVATAAWDVSTLQWSPQIQVRPVPLNPYEQKFFARYPGVTTQKQKFQFQGITGSLVLVASPTWQAHHAPELCLTASGYRIESMKGQALTPKITGRWLRLDGGKKTATYWFQSATQTSDDFFVRFREEVFRTDPSWTLVSIVFDRSHSPNEPPMQNFLTLVRDTLDPIQMVRGKS
jgi:exosortase O